MASILVMLNYEIDPSVVLPVGTELDTFNGHHFVSLVGFHGQRIV